MHQERAHTYLASPRRVHAVWMGTWPLPLRVYAALVENFSHHAAHVPHAPGYSSAVLNSFNSSFWSLDLSSLAHTYTPHDVSPHISSLLHPAIQYTHPIPPAPLATCQAPLATAHAGHLRGVREGSLLSGSEVTEYNMLEPAAWVRCRVRPIGWALPRDGSLSIVLKAAEVNRTMLICESACIVTPAKPLLLLTR